MVDELLSLRVIAASAAKHDRDLLRHAAAAAKVPVEILEADNAAACSLLAGGVDLVLLDAKLGSDQAAHIAAAARAAPKAPFTVLLGEPDAAAPFATDALAAKPADLAAARKFVGAAVHIRLPSRVLVVDDSSTMRAIVRKTLAATRFPMHVTEAAQGVEAIELARAAAFDILMIDYRMPGFGGLETIAEFRREKRPVTFGLITSARDEGLVERARAQGAAFLKKPFFPALRRERALRLLRIEGA